MKSAILHIGLPKTGTTSIQRMLFEAAKSGALPGVGYHLPFSGNMHSQHLLWALFRRDKPLSRWPQFEINRLSAETSVQSALEQCWDRIAQSDKVVLSSEYFPSWSKEEVDALALRFREAGFSRVHVVVYVREPAQAYLSFAQQYIRAADRLPLPKDFKPGYERAIEKFRTVFGTVEVRVFDRHQMLDGCAVRDFVSVLEREFSIRVEPQRLVVVNANDTLSAEAMIVLLEWRRAHFSNNNAVSTRGNRLVQVLLSSRKVIEQTKPVLKPAVARMVQNVSVSDVDYLRRYGVSFAYETPTMDEGREAPDREQQGDISDHDVASILAHHDPQVLIALRLFVQQHMADERTAPISNLPAHESVIFADRLDARVWQFLKSSPCELHFIGASVTAQKPSWAEALHTLLVEATGHAHEITKNAMGGVGILFGLSYYYSSGGRPRITFIEFSTGDFNIGLSPPTELGWMIEALVARVRDEGGEVILVHNWRSDNREKDDSRGVFSIYQMVSHRCGVATIHNNRWVEHQLHADPAQEKRLFRDICHTTPLGARAYAQHVFDALRTAPASSLGDGVERAKQPADWPQVLCLGTAFMHGEVQERTYEYPGTGQKIPFYEMLQGAVMSARVSGRLMGVGLISGPTSGWAALYVDGKLVRRIRCFDEHSYYERYILRPLFIDLQARIVELRMIDESVDFSLARKQHQDFAAPRRLMFAHFVGTRLVAEPQSRAVAHER